VYTIGYILEKGKKLRAALISIEDFKTRFLDKQAEEERARDRAESVLHHILELPEFFAVPELFGFEVLSVLSRLHPQPYRAFSTAITPVLQCGLLRYPMTKAFVERSGRFTLQGLTEYDAAYAALAEELEGCRENR
jgi:predicted nucleic acid-binding protein